jgi:DNA polymerase-3 subunit epsilon
MGRCIAPCRPERRPAHDRLLAWVEHAVEDGGGLLLDRLDALMRARADALRFEEAAEVRERSLCLARALERRRALRTLAASGELLVCLPGRNGVEVAALADGRLVQSWIQPAAEPVDRARAFEAPTLDAEPAAEAADIEELMIVWRFLARAARRSGWVESCSGELASRVGDRWAAERLAAERRRPGTAPGSGDGYGRLETSTSASSAARARPESIDSPARASAPARSGASPTA